MTLHSLISTLALLPFVFFGACSSPANPVATLDELTAAISDACDTGATCGGPQGDCSSQGELVDAVTRQSSGAPECDGVLYGEYVDYNHCLAALSCAEFNTDTSCEAMIDQMRIDASCF